VKVVVVVVLALDFCCCCCLHFCDRFKVYSATFLLESAIDIFGLESFVFMFL
jgi:hypothetical protein